MESSSATSPAHSARSVGRTKYGKSCTNCSKAKCKCSYIAGRLSCERCDRLNKQCKPLVSVRRGDPQPSSPVQYYNNDDLVNTKLDELISLLKARQNVQAGNNSVESPQTDEEYNTYGPETSLPMHLRLDPTSLAEMTDDATASTTFSDIDHSNRGHPKEIPVPKIPVSPEQATRCFTSFRQVMLPWLPFMHVPESMTVTGLQHKWPTLHLCVMATAATSTSQLYNWSEQFRQTVVKKMYDSGERSLDLLLAILAFIGWLRHHRQERPFYNLWLHMATTLVSDLGLDKRAQTDNTWWPWHRESVESDQSILEQRAVLAVFVLSSISASSIKSVDSLHWTPYMDICLTNLEQNPEWSGDNILACQSRCCLITEALNRIGQPAWPFSSRSIFDGVKPIAFQKNEIIVSLERQLAALKTRVAALGLNRNFVVTMSIVTTELDIHEAVALPRTPSEEDYLPPIDRLSRYHSQLACLRTWWDTFLDINPNHLYDVSFPVLTQLIHCIVSLFRLTTLDYPGWDRQVVRNTADIIDRLALFADIVERAHQQIGLICDRGDDLLIKTAKTMRKLRQYFLNILIMIDPLPGGPDPSSLEFNEAIPDMMDLDFWSSQWLADMITSWEK